MKFKEPFFEKVKKYNGQMVKAKIVLIDGTNHPLGVFGGEMTSKQNAVALRNFSSTGEVVITSNNSMEFYADMEIVINSIGEKIVLINPTLNCDCLEIFRPDPPMDILGKDMSLWWSYHSLDNQVKNQLKLLKPHISDNKNCPGDSFPIRDVFIEGISHCL